MSDARGLPDKLSQMELQIDMLRSIEAVRRLRASYSKHVMTGEWKQLVSLFTRDGIFCTVTSDGERWQWQGHEEIYANAVRLKMKVLPMISNELVDFDGNHAAGTCTMMTPISSNPKSPNGFFGNYYDEFRREDGEWLFSLRRFELHGGAF